MITTIIETLIFGSLILLSFLTLTNPLKVNKKANRWFGISLLLLSTFWIDKIVLPEGNNTLNTYLELGFRFIQFFTPIVFFISFIHFTSPKYRFKKTAILYLIAPVIYLLGLLSEHIFYTDYANIFQYINLGVVLIQALFYISASYIKVRQHQKKIQLYSSNTIEIDLNWLKSIILFMLIMAIGTVIYNIFMPFESLNLFMNLFTLTIIYFIAYNSLRQKEIFPLDENQREEIITISQEDESTKPKRKLVSEDELISLKALLTDIMQQQKPYLDCDINLMKLSELLNITPHQLSYVINTGFNENFFQYINRHRIEKAKELLLKEDTNNLSILGIAFESGFRSKTSFNTTFKKITNQTPSEFKKSSSNL